MRFVFSVHVLPCQNSKCTIHNKFNSFNVLVTPYGAIVRRKVCGACYYCCTVIVVVVIIMILLLLLQLLLLLLLLLYIRLTMKNLIGREHSINSR